MTEGSRWLAELLDGPIDSFFSLKVLSSCGLLAFASMVSLLIHRDVHVFFQSFPIGPIGMDT